MSFAGAWARVRVHQVARLFLTHGRLTPHGNAAHLWPCCILGIFNICGKIKEPQRFQRCLLWGVEPGWVSKVKRSTWDRTAAGWRSVGGAASVPLVVLLPAL